MSYGLVVCKETDNIGDDILSYAAWRWLPRVDYIIDREHMDMFLPQKQEFVHTIVNGWFLYNKLNWPPSPYIDPLFVGIHFTTNSSYGITEEYLDGVGKDYLNRNGKIGCRDYHTLDLMRKREIDAYFSGCMTMTLSPFPGVAKTDKIMLVDVYEDAEHFVKEHAAGENVEVFSHNLPISGRGKEWEERRKFVETVLKKYQSAKLVVTSRLHCALPCLALGTPVVLVYEESDDFKSRISSFKKYVTCVTSDELKENFDMYCNGKYKNSDEYLTLRRHLEGICGEFIQKCEKLDCSISAERELKLLKENWHEQVRWQKSLLEDKGSVLGTEYSELYESKKWLAEQYEYKNKRIGELENSVVWLKSHSDEQEKYIKNLEAVRDDLQNECSMLNKKAILLNNLQQTYDEVIHSKSWRIGRAVTWLPRKLLKQRSPEAAGGGALSFDKIVSLGCNCEVSFRIEDYQKRPIDSYLYSWCYELDPELFAESLYHMDEILCGPVEVQPWGMFLDKTWQLSFHGKGRKDQLFLENGELNQEVADQMIEELRSRVRHLTDKFQKLLKSDHRTLFIFKVPSWQEGGSSVSLVRRVCEFLEQEYLSGNYRLLVVLEEKNQGFREASGELKKYKKLQIKYIKEFAPDDNTKNGGDIEGWLKAIDSAGKFDL